LESFNQFRKTRDWTAADRAFSLAMTRSLVTFAKTGRPSTGTFKWAGYSPNSRLLLNLGDTATIASWPVMRKLSFFRTVIERKTTGGAVRD